MNKAIIYTDGSSLGNPGPGGYGIILEIRDENDNLISKNEYSESFKVTTNNRMELLAVIVGLECLIEPHEVTIWSDSRYVIDAINEGWLYNWMRKGWKTSSKKLVKNLDLWHRLLKVMKGHNIEFRWVKGHSNNPNNERCDEIANIAAGFYND